MADVFTPEKRSAIMARVKNRNTKPEILVRSMLHALGYRFRLHRKDLPGTPDVVLPRHRKVVLVHGCLWHGHPGCRRAARPTTNAEFWNRKIDANLRRDAEALKKLTSAGWQVLTVWECQTRNQDTLRGRLQQFMQSTKEQAE